MDNDRPSALNQEPSRERTGQSDGMANSQEDGDRAGRAAVARHGGLGGKRILAKHTGKYFLSMS